MGDNALNSRCSTGQPPAATTRDTAPNKSPPRVRMGSSQGTLKKTEAGKGGEATHKVRNEDLIPYTPRKTSSAAGEIEGSMAWNPLIGRSEKDTR